MAKIYFAILKSSQLFLSVSYRQLIQESSYSSKLQVMLAITISFILKLYWKLSSSYFPDVCFQFDHRSLSYVDMIAAFPSYILNDGVGRFSKGIYSTFDFKRANYYSFLCYYSFYVHLKIP